MRWSPFRRTLIDVLLAMALALGPSAAARAQAPTPSAAPAVDLLIRGGRIVDGTGNPSFTGDVAIAAGKILAVGKVPGTWRAARTVDAGGLVVAPGFIDIHNHSDNSLLVDGEATSALHQGLTTVILGEGPSAAPSREYPRFTDYFARLVKQGIAINVGSYVGSSQIWGQVHGARGGPLSKAEGEQARALVRQAMEDGALGVSSSLSGPPGSWIDTDSLVLMATAAAPYGGIFSTHMRHEGLDVEKAVDEALEVGRRAKVPVDIIHIKIAERSMWGQMPRLIGKLAAARARGVEVEANVYPYRAGQNDLGTIVPPWAHEGGRDALLKRLQDPGDRARIEKEIKGGVPGWYNHYTATGSWEGMLLVSLAHPDYKRFQGKRMNEVIKTLGGPGDGGARDFEVFFKLLVDNRGSVPTVFFHHSEEDMMFALQQPFVSVGSDGGALKVTGPLSAGNPHPRFYGTFPRVLGRYVREKKIISLEEAVRKMTSANSAKVKVYDRGLLRAGQWADVTVFDPARIIDKATFEKPHQYSEGVQYVVVAGQVVLDRGRPTAARPGRIVMGPGKR